MPAILSDAHIWEKCSTSWIWQDYFCRLQESWHVHASQEGSKLHLEQFKTGANQQLLAKLSKDLSEDMAQLTAMAISRSIRYCFLLMTKYAQLSRNEFAYQTCFPHAGLPLADFYLDCPYQASSSADLSVQLIIEDLFQELLLLASPCSLQELVRGALCLIFFQMCEWRELLMTWSWGLQVLNCNRIQEEASDCADDAAAGPHTGLSLDFTSFRTLMEEVLVINKGVPRDYLNQSFMRPKEANEMPSIQHSINPHSKVCYPKTNVHISLQGRTRLWVLRGFW